MRCIDHNRIWSKAGIGVRADARFAGVSVTLLLHAAAIGAAFTWTGNVFAPQVKEYEQMPVFTLRHEAPTAGKSGKEDRVRVAQSAAVLQPAVRGPSRPSSMSPTPSVAAMPQAAPAPSDMKPALDAPPRASFPSASAGPSDSEVVRYRDQLWRHIAAHRPHNVQRRGTVLVKFRIDMNGALVDASIAGSSGDFNLDRIALRTLRQSAPFPAPPAAIVSGQLEFTVPVNFH